ncbi:MAG TPA: hypothetical protein VF641_04260 [Methylobacterium sp.]|jgi:hypothetical protein
MTKTTLALAAALLGGITLGAGQASAVPAGPATVQTDASTITRVGMMERRMMKRRMMERRMMKRRMMKRQMMRRM